MNFFKKLCVAVKEKVVAVKEQAVSFFSACAKKATVPAVAAVSLMAAPAFADTKKAIEDAIAAGQENYGLVTAGVIGVSALGFALTMIVSWLRK